MNNTIITGYVMVIMLLLVCLNLSILLLAKAGKMIRTMEIEVSKLTSTDLLDPKPRRIDVEELKEIPTENDTGEETGVATEETQESDVNEVTGNAP